MLARRLLVLAAVLLALGAVAASIAPRDLRGPVTTTSATPMLAPPPAPLPGRELSLSVEASAARPRTVSARVGDHVHLAVGARQASSITIAALDRTQPVDPYSPAVFDFVADRAGTFSIAFSDTGVRIATLRVTGAY